MHITKPLLLTLLLGVLLPFTSAHAQTGSANALESLLQGANAVGDDELLPPEQAFALQVAPDAPDLIAIEYQVAEGYYLYRDKFRFETDTPGVELGTAWVPAGELKHDEFFGEVETHRGLVSIGLLLVTLLDLNL